jgi:pectate lyase
MLVKTLFLTQLVWTAAAFPWPQSFKRGGSSGGTQGLEGFAKNNPIGPTTGGAGGVEVTVSTAAELVAAAAGNDRKIIRIKGEISLPSRLSVGSNKSLLGVGTTAHIRQSGITVKDQDNVIIRNIKVSHIEGDDCITLRNSTRVWVDHNEFSSDISKGPDFYVSEISCAQVSGK